MFKLISLFFVMLQQCELGALSYHVTDKKTTAGQHSTTQGHLKSSEEEASLSGAQARVLATSSLWLSMGRGTLGWVMVFNTPD